MDKYINATLAIRSLKSKYCNGCRCDTCMPCRIKDKIEFLEEESAVEVEEVKHGKWLWELQGIGKMNCKCTNCQEWFPINYEELDEYGSPERETKRCPNCGAIMEGSDE